MPATLIWGKGLRLAEEPTPSGQPNQHIVGIARYSDMISWSSVGEMESLAEQHGVSKAIWPIYRNCEIESEVPLDDAVRRSVELRTALQNVDPRVVEGDYWLNHIWKLLRDGNAFFIMV